MKWFNFFRSKKPDFNAIIDKVNECMKIHLHCTIEHEDDFVYILYDDYGISIFAKGYTMSEAKQNFDSKLRSYFTSFFLDNPDLDASHFKCMDKRINNKH